MDIGGRDYWLCKEMHTRGGQSGFRMAHTLQVCIFFLCMIAHPKSKTGPLVPEFAVEYLPLDRTATLFPRFAVKELSLDRAL